MLPNLNSEIMIGKCEYCQADRVQVMSTPEKSFCCIECSRFRRFDCNAAIKQLGQYAAKEKPIIFSMSEVKATLENKKTQTRRVIKPQPPRKRWTRSESWALTDSRFVEVGKHKYGHPYYMMPRYKPRDILWVRETWLLDEFGYQFKVLDNGQISYDDGSTKWRPSIHMPRAAARILLLVKNVRVERLQEISDKDAIAEGCTGIPCDHINADLFGGSSVCADCMNTGWIEPPRVEFVELWNNANAKCGYGWDSNPWVWVYEFERMV